VGGGERVIGQYCVSRNVDFEVLDRKTGIYSLQKCARCSLINYRVDVAERAKVQRRPIGARCSFLEAPLYDRLAPLLVALRRHSPDQCAHGRALLTAPLMWVSHSGRVMNSVQLSQKHNIVNTLGKKHLLRVVQVSNLDGKTRNTAIG
jgi:hypothetical protein